MQQSRDCKNPSCDEVFIVNVHNQRYCSEQCKNEVKNLRRKAMVIDDERYVNLNSPLENGANIGKPSLREKTAAPPPVWKPGVVWDGNEGEITSRPEEHPSPHWDDILKSWGYDPQEFEIVEPVKVSTWDVQTPDGVKQMWSYKAGIVRKSQSDESSIAELLEEIKHYRPRVVPMTDGSDTLIVCIADTQFGKEDGDGLKGTIQRFVDAIESVEQRINELRAIGRNINHLVVAGMGDIIENCEGQYATQTYAVEANRREQIRIARRLIRDAIMRWAPYFEKVTVLAVPGNHGENRRNGKMFTGTSDNDDVAIFEILAEVFDANREAFGHVEFLIPDDEISITIDVGKIVGFTHGHVARTGGTSAQAKLRSWWEKQAFGEQPVGDASILISAHYHHFSIVEYGSKVHMQCPSLDGGSKWWTDARGEHSRPGILTFVVNTNGWQDLEVL